MPVLVRPLLVLFLAAVWAGPATAGTFYVSSHGNDRRSGTSPAKAWRTVGRVDRARLRPGDVVLFRGGDTFTDATLTPRTSGTSSRPIVFSSYGGGKARLRHDGITVWFRGARNLVFENLDLSNEMSDDAIVAGSPGGGSTGITIRGCAIHDTRGPGISSPSPADSHWKILGNDIFHIGNSGVIVLGSDSEITRNTISDTGWNDALGYDRHGIYMRGRGATVVQNTISGFQANGISLRSADAHVLRNTIRGGQFAIAYFDFESQPGSSVVEGNRTSGVRVGFYFSRDPDALSGGNPVENFLIHRNVFDVNGGGAALDVTGGRFSRIAIVGNVIEGSFTTPIAAYSPTTAGMYVEQQNVIFGPETFAWNGSWLRYTDYRAASGQGLGDRFVIRPP